MGIQTTKKLQADNIFPEVSKINLSEKLAMGTRKGLEMGIISAGKLVNVVSDGYGLLKNEDFFLPAEEALINADLKYDIRTINRKDGSFAADYILNDDSFAINVAEGISDRPDKLQPMISLRNSYDGSCKTSGSIAIYRKVCSNGLHAVSNIINFSFKHRGDVETLALTNIRELVEKFMNNEFYQLRKKFQVLAETQITDLRGWVKMVCDKTGIFQYVASEKNPDPSLNARLVLDTIGAEALALGSNYNAWLGYNAFNAVIHDKLKKPFDGQKSLDKKIFDTILQLS